MMQNHSSLLEFHAKDENAQTETNQHKTLSGVKLEWWLADCTICYLRPGRTKSISEFLSFIFSLYQQYMGAGRFFDTDKFFVMSYTQLY